MKRSPARSSRSADDEGSGLRADDWELLREVCGGDQALFDLQVALLGVERQFRGMSRRAGIYEVLEDRLRTGIYGTEQEAVTVLRERLMKREQGRQTGLISAKELPERMPKPKTRGRANDSRSTQAQKVPPIIFSCPPVLNEEGYFWKE